MRVLRLEGSKISAGFESVSEVRLRGHERTTAWCSVTMYLVALPSPTIPPGYKPSDWMIGVSRGMDERVQKAIREAERAGHLLTPRPGDEVLRWLWKVLVEGCHWRDEGREQAARVAAREWLISVGLPADLPFCSKLVDPAGSCHKAAGHVGECRGGWSAP